MPTLQRELRYNVFRYDIYRGTSPNNITYIDSVASATTEYIDTYSDFVNYTTYYYSVHIISACDNEITLHCEDTTQIEYVDPYHCLLPLAYSVTVIQSIQKQLAYYVGQFTDVRMPNGGFETGDLSYWSTSGATVSVTSGAARSGNYGVQFTVSSGGSSSCSLYRSVDTIDSKEITFYYKLVNPQISSGAKITVSGNFSDYNYYKEYTSSNVPSDWVKATITTGRASGIQTFTINVTVSGTASSTVYIDDVIITQLTEPNVVNGNFETGDMDRWAVYNQAITVTDPVYKGTYACKIDDGSSIRQTIDLSVIDSISAYINVPQGSCIVINIVKNGQTLSSAVEWYSGGWKLVTIDTSSYTGRGMIEVISFFGYSYIDYISTYSVNSIPVRYCITSFNTKNVPLRYDMSWLYTTQVNMKYNISRRVFVTTKLTLNGPIDYSLDDTGCLCKYISHIGNYTVSAISDVGRLIAKFPPTFKYNREVARRIYLYTVMALRVRHDV